MIHLLSVFKTYSTIFIFKQIDRANPSVRGPSSVIEIISIQHKAKLFIQFNADSHYSLFLAMLMLMLVIPMLILMLLNLNTGYADNDLYNYV